MIPFVYQKEIGVSKLLKGKIIMKRQVIPQDHNLLTEISVAYYQEDMTQEEIAQKYGISRIKVGRLLKKAREEGIVDISVRYHPIFSSGLEQELINTFGIQRALIAVDDKDEAEQRRQVGALVASFLSTTLKNNQTVAVGYGANISAITSFTGNLAEKRCRFISSIGGVDLTDRTVNTDYIVQTLATKFSATSETLYAPAYVESTDAKNLIERNSMVKDVITHAQNADIAIVEIDNFDNHSQLVKAGLFSTKEVLDLQREQGVTCELAGYGLLDSQGTLIESAVNHHTVGLSVDDLKKIPCVIGIASENTKAMAIMSALKSGLINVVATTAHNVNTILTINKSK